MKTKTELDGLRRRLLVHRNDKDYSVVAFVISEYIRLFLLALFFISNPVYSFRVYSEENRTFLKVKTRRYRLID